MRIPTRPRPEGIPAAPFNENTGRRYNLTLSAFTLNLLNCANLAPPVDDLSPPYFGQSLALADLIGI